MVEFMVVQGPVHLIKRHPGNAENCDGCFFKNISCAEASSLEPINGRLPCTAEDYIWEVSEIG